MSFFKMTVGVSITVVLVGIIGTFYLYYNQDKYDFHFMDSSDFKKEYESLNGRVVKGKNYSHITINVSDNNPMIYSDYEEVIDIIKNGTGIIYLGYNTCADCRNIVPVLIDVAEEYDIEKIYYLDIHEDIETYKVVEDEPIINSKGTSNYYALIDSLGDNVSLYMDTFKTIEFPSVIFVREGNILGVHTGTIESHNNKLYSLTLNQSEELKNIYKSYIDKIIEVE